MKRPDDDYVRAGTKTLFALRQEKYQEYLDSRRPFQDEAMDVLNGLGLTVQRSPDGSSVFVDDYVLSIHPDSLLDDGRRWAGRLRGWRSDSDNVDDHLVWSMNAPQKDKRNALLRFIDLIEQKQRGVGVNDARAL